MKPDELADQLEKQLNKPGGQYIAKSYVLEKLDEVHVVLYQKIKMECKNMLNRKNIIQILRGEV